MVTRGGGRDGEAPLAGPTSASRATATIAGMPNRTFAKFSFFKLDPAWLRRDLGRRAEDKRQLLAAREDFSKGRSLGACSTVGTRFAAVLS